MDFSLLTAGAPALAEGGNSSSEGVAEYKLLFSGKNLLSGKGSEGFVNVFRNALGGNPEAGLAEREIPLALPLAGKLLPESGDLSVESLGLDADQAPQTGEYDGEDEQLPAMELINPFLKDFSRPPSVDSALVMSSEDAKTGRRQLISARSVGNAGLSDTEEATRPFLSRGQGLKLSASEPDVEYAVTGSAASSTRLNLSGYPGAANAVSGEVPATRDSRLPPADGSSPSGQGAGRPALSTVPPLPAAGTPVSSGDSVLDSSGWRPGVSLVQDRPDLPARMVEDRVPAESRKPGNRNESGPLPISVREGLKGQPAQAVDTRLHVFPDAAGISMTQAAAAPLPRIRTVWQPATGNARSQQVSGVAADRNTEGMFMTADATAARAGVSFQGSPAAEKLIAESAAHARAGSTQIENRLDPSVSSRISGEADDGVSAMATRQAPAHGNNMPGMAGVQPLTSRQAEIGVPLGHAAWEQSLARQVLMAGQGQLRELHIKLNPSHLGSIDISLQVDGDSASIAFSSQHAVVREAVESSLPRLREMFSGSGINLGNVDVGGQDTARGQEREAQQGGDIAPQNAFSGGDEEEHSGTTAGGMAARKGNVEHQLLDYYV
jgi:hypothetical protein